MSRTGQVLQTSISAARHKSISDSGKGSVLSGSSFCSTPCHIRPHVGQNTQPDPTSSTIEIL
eukprot:COSAG06_NODE_21081_length_770_cov_0.640835_1_plen_62_part_00